MLMQDNEAVAPTPLPSVTLASTPAAASSSPVATAGYTGADAVPPAVASSNLPQAGSDGADAEGEDDDAPPPLQSEPTGILGIGAKMLRSKGAELAEHERVKKSVDYIKEKSQPLVDKALEKKKEISESERVRKSVEYAKDKAQVVSTKASEVHDKVKEKTTEGVEFAKEKTKGLREGAGKVWESGRGSIQRVKSNVGNMAWRGSARDTLDIAAREEQWKGIKIQGAEEISVPARTEHTCCYHVSKGSTLRWTFRVKDNDIGFGVRMRVQEWGGSREDEVLATEKYDSSDTISGSWVADEDRTMVLVFDNKYSKLRSKTVAYFTGTEKPPVFVESPATEAADAAPVAAAGPVAVEPAPAAPAAAAEAPPRPIV